MIWILLRLDMFKKLSEMNHIIALLNPMRVFLLHKTLSTAPSVIQIATNEYTNMVSRIFFMPWNQTGFNGMHLFYNIYFKIIFGFQLAMRYLKCLIKY